MQLTKFKINIRVGQRTKNIGKAYDDAEINKKWGETELAKRLARKKLRENLTDFERFKNFWIPTSEKIVRKAYSSGGGGFVGDEESTKEEKE
uniref:Ribosomal protein L14e domain-containing protein n=1 Tax=Meloidogyne floridensis TaxID=298350 RepID=A0A915NDR7_9BILA